jgi:hypothetical protein
VEKDEALACLERGYRARNGNLALYLKVDPALGSLRSDPRFADLLRPMNLSP